MLVLVSRSSTLRWGEMMQTKCIDSGDNQASSDANPSLPPDDGRMLRQLRDQMSSLDERIKKLEGRSHKELQQSDVFGQVSTSRKFSGVVGKKANPIPVRNRKKKTKRSKQHNHQSFLPTIPGQVVEVVIPNPIPVCRPICVRCGSCHPGNCWVCFKCGKIGHLSRYCRNSKSGNQP